MRAVLKIGGGILRNAQDLEMIAKILRMNSKRENIVVVSAFNGITNMLLDAYAKKDDITGQLREKHAAYFAPQNPKVEGILAELGKRLKEGGDVAAKEWIASCGERLSALIIADYLNSAGIPALAMDAKECGIVTNGKMENASCIMDETIRNFGERVVPKINGNVLVITGYYGIDRRGRVTTFGRGGSDYSAAVVAVATDSQVLEIWKDVEGFMSADPRIVANAKKLPFITFDEARELGYLGSKILHPRTMDPLEGTEIYVEIKSVLAPERTGTKILKQRKLLGKPITAVAAKKGVAIVNVRGGRMVEVPGAASEIFDAIAKAGISVDAIATSQTNISFTVDEKYVERVKIVLDEVKEGFLDSHEIKPGMALVGAVGEEMKNKVGIAQSILLAVAKRGVSVEMMTADATQENVTMIVRKECADECVRAIHDEFKLGE